MKITPRACPNDPLVSLLRDEEVVEKIPQEACGSQTFIAKCPW